VNAQNDRETDGYSAVDYIRLITRTLNASYQPSYGGLGQASTLYPISAFITHMVYLKDTRVEVDLEMITMMGVKCVEAIGQVDEKTGTPRFDSDYVRRAIAEILSERDEGH